jgi:hypothetical protein
MSAATAQTHVLRGRVAVGVEGKLEAVQVVLARYVPFSTLLVSWMEKPASPLPEVALLV